MKKTVIFFLKVAVSVVILALIFSKVNINQIWSTLSKANLLYLTSALMVYFMVQGLSAYRWHCLLKPLDIKARYPRILSIYSMGMYFNFFLPSAIGGDVFRIYYLNKDTSRLSASTASVFLDRDVGMGGLLLVATLVAAISGTRLGGEQGVLLYPIFGIITIGFILANLVLFYRPTYNLLHRLLRLFKLKGADVKVERLFSSVNAYRGKWRLLGAALLMSVGVQIGCAIVNMIAAAAIGLHTRNGWLDYLVFIPAIGLIGMIPASVNGMGWREMSYILLFQSVIVAVAGNPSPTQQDTEAAALALSFLWLGVLVATALPGGILYVMGGRRRPGALVEDGIDPDQAGQINAAKGQGHEGDHFSTLSSNSPENEPISTI
jgi:uncharacterized protein (TIRG00374 family)